METILAKANAMRTQAIIIGLLATLIAVICSLLIARSIVLPIRNIIDGLTAIARQVASESNLVSGTSQQMAQDSTEQAASLEESSSALEELAGQAQGNATSADQVEAFMQGSKSQIENTKKAMEQMVETMGAIKVSSGKVSGIIKTIEEIAFQTNLLALNAAVEAARAGEHGKGFAVVAEEVRNLAQRSATAAKDTTSLIETSVEQSNKGVNVVGRAAEGIEKIAEQTSGIATHVSGIASASKEQSQGIGQINNAVAQMDQVTQRLAASAEESASASHELSSQAQNMQELVDDLTVLVQGNAHRIQAPAATPPSNTLHARVKHTALPGKAQPSKLGKPDQKKLGASPTPAAKVIPFDHEDEHFGDF